MNTMTRRAVIATTTGLVVGMLSLLAAVLPTSAGDSRPFKGHSDEMVIDAEPVADDLIVTAVGRGQATHLGRFTSEVSVVSHADGTFEGTIVFTAANGDQLFADIEGTPT